MSQLDHFFSPKGVAVIGASRDPKKVGHVIFRNFFEGHFRGKVYPVNPHAEEIFGERAYRSVLDIPGTVDLAVITVPAPLVCRVLEECGRKRIPAAIVVSAGFSEIGNTRLEEDLKAMAKTHGIRLLGPNCLGVVDPATGVDTMFLPRYKLQRPQAGSIAYLSQSGATLSVVLDVMGMKGYRISKAVSFGNAADIDEADLLRHLANDPSTAVVCAYLEGVREGRKFFETARELSLRKPIVVLKGGSTPAGTQAALSHTGSLAGEARVFDGMLRQAGAVKAADLEQVFDFARVFSTQPLPSGGRVQIITNGGGYGVLTADAAFREGLELARMRPQAVAALRKALPSHVVIKNPLDLTGDADTERYRLAISAALQDPGVDMLAVITLFQVPTLTGDVVEVIAESRGRKPLVVIAGGGDYTEALKRPLEDQGVPTFSYSERAVAALKALHDWAQRHHPSGR